MKGLESLKVALEKEQTLLLNDSSNVTGDVRDQLVKESIEHTNFIDALKSGRIADH